ncbi:MAG: hypothetical protein LW817_03360 [Candidatus Caenarcaniphilales bacterium]|jgi:flagellar hook assembly protein FlgD|nr:hypothetical protein [Candidatus Caenarcaniphilales bacterium]
MDGIVGTPPISTPKEAPTGRVDIDYINKMVEKTKSANGGSADGFDRDMFLKILMTQLQNQSPFDTVETEQILQQQATLTQVEQSTKQTTSMETLSKSVADGLKEISASLNEIKGLLK